MKKSFQSALKKEPPLEFSSVLFFIRAESLSLSHTCTHARCRRPSLSFLIWGMRAHSPGCPLRLCLSAPNPTVEVSGFLLPATPRVQTRLRASVGSWALHLLFHPREHHWGHFSRCPHWHSQPAHVSCRWSCGLHLL